MLMRHAVMHFIDKKPDGSRQSCIWPTSSARQRRPRELVHDVSDAFTLAMFGLPARLTAQVKRAAT